MKLAGRSILWLLERLLFSVTSGIAGACLCALIGAIEGALIGPFVSLFVFVGSKGAGFDRSLCLIGGVYGALVLGLLGFLLGGLLFGFLEAFSSLVLHSKDVLNFSQIGAVAARLALLCAFCGAITGCFIQDTGDSLPNLSPQGAIVGWGTGLTLGALWSGMARSRWVSSVPPLDALVCWLWGEKRT